MKKIQIIITILFLTIAGTSFAQTTKKDTIHVWGNCEMCKTTIEKAAKKAGASYANWDTETKQLVVRYTANKITNSLIQKTIAASGYDTELFTGSNAAYDKLHGCCKYDRKETTSSNQQKQ
jgi:mercuric ion binding protein